MPLFPRSRSAEPCTCYIEKLHLGYLRFTGGPRKFGRQVHFADQLKRSAVQQPQ